jgi:hypothetical protein
MIKGVNEMKTKALGDNGGEIINNISTRIYAIIFGILTGLGGAVHGIYETLQGNKPTTGFVLAGIGAVSVIPNYLITGIAAIIISIFVIVWTIGFIHKNSGPNIFIILSIILFLVGGGIGQVIIFLLAWAVATRINKPLSWWEQILPLKVRKYLARLWFPILLFGTLIFIIGFGIWLFVIPPGELREITIIYYVCWSFLILGTLVLLIDIVCGFARDLELRSKHEIK